MTSRNEGSPIRTPRVDLSRFEATGQPSGGRDSSGAMPVLDQQPVQQAAQQPDQQPLQQPVRQADLQPDQQPLQQALPVPEQPLGEPVSQMTQAFIPPAIQQLQTAGILTEYQKKLDRRWLKKRPSKKSISPADPSGAWPGASTQPLQAEQDSSKHPVQRANGSQKSLLRRTLGVLRLLCFYLVLLGALHLFLIQVVRVEGGQMAPSLQAGQRALMLKAFYTIKPGDRVVHTSHAQGLDLKPADLMNRVIAGPGDRVDLEPDGIYVNHQKLHEPYLPEGIETQAVDLRYSHVVLDRYQYYLLGDARDAALDSRFYGPVLESELVGKILWSWGSPDSNANHRVEGPPLQSIAPLATELQPEASTTSTAPLVSQPRGTRHAE